MKTPKNPTSSVARLLTAMALMAASSVSLAQAENLSGSAYGPILDMPEGLFSAPVPAAEYRRGAIAKMIITKNGSVSLAFEFRNRVHRQTGVFVVDENAPEPTYVADLGTTSNGYHLKAYLYTNVGDVNLEWLTPGGDYYFHTYLSHGADRNAGEIFPKPRPYNTVHFDGAPMNPDDPSKSPVFYGAGHGIMMISASGVSIFVGKLPDGQTVTGGGQMTWGSATFHAPMMLRTPSGRDTLCGTLPGIDDVNAPNYLRWVKGASSGDALLPSGGWCDLAALTSPYSPPTPSQLMIPGIQNGPLNIVLGFQAADREPPADTMLFLKKLFTLTHNNKAVFPAPNTDKLLVTFLPSLGFFTGKVKLSFTPPMQPKMVSFSGVVKQHHYMDPSTGEEYWATGEARGFYLAAPLPGTVEGLKVSGNVFIFPAD